MKHQPGFRKDGGVRLVRRMASGRMDKCRGDVERYLHTEMELSSGDERSMVLQENS